jgi:hypothetical protein
MTETKHLPTIHPEVVESRTIMHPLVEKMMASHPTPEALEKILNLQREWEKDEAKRAFTAGLVELKRALPLYLQRDKLVDFKNKEGRQTRYTHTSLAAAMETVTPILVDHGFSLTWTTESGQGGGVKVTATLTHRQGHSKECSLIAPPDQSGNKNSAQAVASTVTLLERYTALALLGLSTADQAEPTGEAAPPPAEDVGRVDTKRNMKAMAALLNAGKGKLEVERFVGRPVTQWTTADLDKLRAWIKPVPPPPPVPAHREPGADDEERPPFEKFDPQKPDDIPF